MNQDGFTKLPNSLWAAPVSPGAKLTYAAIARFAYGTKTTAWPSQATLARQTGYSERSIRRFAAELEAAGLIRIERRSGTSSVYELLDPVGHSGVGSQTGLTVHTPRPEGPYAPDPESAKEDDTNKEDKTKKGNQEAFSPDRGSGVRVEGVRVEGEGGAESAKLFGASDLESWTLVPGHLKISVPGFALRISRGATAGHSRPRSSGSSGTGSSGLDASPAQKPQTNSASVPPPSCYGRRLGAGSVRLRSRHEEER
jgi:hypothetical protein